MKRRAVLHPITPEITCIDDAGASVCYVVCGTERAAVIDTVNGMENLYDIVREITDLPLVVLNTHGHCDHVYGNTFFDEAYLHPADFALHDAHFAMKKETSLEQAEQYGATKEELEAYIQAPPCPLKPIREGEKIDLGGRTLETILVSGHTPGSICFLDSKTGILFSGDAINGQAWLQLDESRKLKDYLFSLHALDAYRPRITELHNGHNVEAIPLAYVDTVIRGVTEIIAGGGAGDEDFDGWFGPACKRHMLGENHWILYTPDKL